VRAWLLYRPLERFANVMRGLFRKTCSDKMLKLTFEMTMNYFLKKTLRRYILLRNIFMYIGFFPKKEVIKLIIQHNLSND